MAFYVERKARLREAYDSLSEPAQHALRLFLERKMKPSIIARRMGLTTVEARALVAHSMRVLVAAT